MRRQVQSQQASLLLDTSKTANIGVIIKVIDAISVYIDFDDRKNLDGGADVAGNPPSGLVLLNTDPPFIIYGFSGQIWGRGNLDGQVEILTFRNYPAK